MKFKWVGGNGFKDIDLVLAGIKNQNQQLYTGMVIEVPDSEERLIRRLKVNGNYEVYNEPKKVKKPLKIKKEKEEKEDK